MERIAIMTSGGDSPGMNPFVRAAVRRALSRGMRVYGIKRAYAGMIDDDFVEMSARSVGGIIQKGGTVLGTARSKEFMTEEGREIAVANLQKRGIEGLIVMGGDGSLRGAMKLHEMGIKVVGAPGTIDNDMYGTDITIGTDTALNVVLTAIDKIKDTASSHQRAFLIEVMGRHCGYLALIAGIAGGAEIVCIPEVPFTLEAIAKKVADAYVRGKSHCIIVVAEGAQYNAAQINEYLMQRVEETGFEAAYSVLGHIQRGGSPTAYDRILATRLGAAAADCLNRDESGLMVGLLDGHIAQTPIEEVTSNKKELDTKLYELAEVLAQ